MKLIFIQQNSFFARLKIKTIIQMNYKSNKILIFLKEKEKKGHNITV